jgi:hypothetical protein
MVNDPQFMSATEKHDYIFENQRDYYVANRFGWFESLLSDIRTLIEGGQRYKNTVSTGLEGVFGAGNVSIPILVCIGLEFVSALYTGTTKVKDRSSYHADDNVKTFVHFFFPHQGVKIPLILWDGIRNGNTHLFMPNVIKVDNTLIKFTFFVKTNQHEPSFVSESRNEITVHINSIEFYRVYKRALEDYKTKLERSNDLQNNFINAWESIDSTPHDLTKDKYKIPKEVNRLNSRLKFSELLNIFSNAHNGLLLSNYYQDNPQEITKLLRLILRAL